MAKSQSILHEPAHQPAFQPSRQAGTTRSPRRHARYAAERQFRGNKDSFRRTGQPCLHTPQFRRPSRAGAAQSQKRETFPHRRQHTLFRTARQRRGPSPERDGKRVQSDFRRLQRNHRRRTERHRTGGNPDRRRILQGTENRGGGSQCRRGGFHDPLQRTT